MARQFNYIYMKLVKNENDLLGQIAYSLYKRKKVQFLENWKKAHPEQEIEEDELNTFHNSESTKEALNEYRTKANILLQNFMNTLLEDDRKTIEKACKQNQQAILAEIISPLVPEPQPSLREQYLHGTAQSVLGAIVFAILVAVISFVAYFGGTSLPINITFGIPETTTVTDSTKLQTNEDGQTVSNESKSLQQYNLP